MKYYFILATKEFLFEIEPVEEVLRERAHYYASRNKQVDFWILPAPKFLNYYWNEMSELTKNNSRENLVAIVSTNADFTYWLKLRYQNVISGYFNAPSQKIPDPLTFG
jgi:hypothetical protein